MTRTLAIALLLTGCASFDPPEPTRRAMLITIEPRATLPAGIDGRASWTDAVCHVELREYPKFLGHEIRHCFEGHWHTTPNGEDY